MAMIWAWWAVPAGLVVAFFAYRQALGVAEVYGQLLEATFDLHHTALYESLRLPLPTNPAEEQRLGAQLTEYLWRGTDNATLVFTQLERTNLPPAQ